MIFDLNQTWRYGNWHDNQTDQAKVVMQGAHPKFFLNDAGRRHVWYHTLRTPINPQHYPIAIITYRARNMKTIGYPVIWMDDDRGPGGGGIHLLPCSELIADGEVHELRRDRNHY